MTNQTQASAMEHQQDEKDDSGIEQDNHLIYISNRRRRSSFTKSIEI